MEYSNKTLRTRGYYVKIIPNDDSKRKISYGLFSYETEEMLKGPFRTASKAWKEAKRLDPSATNYRN